MHHSHYSLLLGTNGLAFPRHMQPHTYFFRSKSDPTQFDIMASVINTLQLYILCRRFQPLTGFLNLWGLWMKCRQPLSGNLPLSDSVLVNLPVPEFFVTPPPTPPICPAVASNLLDLCPPATQKPHLCFAETIQVQSRHPRTVVLVSFFHYVPLAQYNERFQRIPEKENHSPRCGNACRD